MEKNKIIGVFFTACILLSSALFAEEIPSVKPNGCKGPVLCSSYPIYGRCDECCDYRWSVNLGLLYQQPWMSNMGAGTSSVAGLSFHKFNMAGAPQYQITTINF